MTLAKAREQWEAKNPEGDFDALSEEQRTAVLTAAVLAERAKRRE